MIFSNLSGTTSNIFKVGVEGKGQSIACNMYDLYWAKTEGRLQHNENINLIMANTDLNTIKGIGQYFMPTNALGIGIVNSPTDKAFIMTVEPSNGIDDNAIYIVQTMKDFDGILYSRGYDGGADYWYPWTRTISNSVIASHALKSELPTIEEGAIVPDAVNGYTQRASNVRYTAYKYSNKTVYDVYGILTLVANNPPDTYSINNLPFAFDSFRYEGFCHFDAISNVTIPVNAQYLHGACTAANGSITFKLYAYNSSSKNIMGWGVNSFVSVANTMFNLSFRVTIG